MALARRASPSIVRLPVGALEMRFDLSDYFQLLMALDEHERASKRFARATLKLARGGVYVDVGAHVGWFAAHAAARIGPAGRMALFEPDPRARAALELNLASRPADRLPRFEIVASPCSDARRTTEFRLAGALGASSLLDLEAASVPHETMTVETTTLDEETDRLGIEKIDLLKIDAEGCEIAVLRGARRLLDARRVDFLIVEKCLPYLRQEGFEAIHLHALLAERGYFGAHEDGRLVGPESLDRAELENLIYARKREELRFLLRGPKAPPAEEPWTDAELRRAFEEAASLDHPDVRARSIVYLARCGQLDRAIEEARAMIAERPAQAGLRGHFAHWLDSTGRREEALEQYRVIARSDPDDVEARRRLETDAPTRRPAP
jgi:FkbM family methyltransferase